MCQILPVTNTWVLHDFFAFSRHRCSQATQRSSLPHGLSAQFCIFMGCLVGGSWVKMKRATVTSASPTNYHMKGTRQNQFRCFLLTSSPLKKKKPLLPALANPHSKGGARPPFDILNYTQNYEARNEKMERPHFEEGTKCLNCNKIVGFRQVNSNSEAFARSLQTTHSRIFFREFQPVTLLPFSIFSHHTPSPALSQPVHGERKGYCLL